MSIPLPKTCPKCGSSQIKPTRIVNRTISYVCGRCTHEWRVIDDDER